MNSYFDYNATTPICPAARDAWREAAERFWHNPSSLYREAGAAKRRLEDAREALADRLGAEPERVVFTSGATEGNNVVMAHAARRQAAAPVVISAIEHPSVREAAFREFGKECVTELSVTPRGAVDLDLLAAQLENGDAPALVSVMGANNETGVIQPWREMAVLCRKHDVPYHCDASQWIGKYPMAGLGESCDFLTGCAHKFGGPKGVGFLLIPEDAITDFHSLVGGPQESGHRAGTEDLPGILGMIAALETHQDAALAEARVGRLADRTAFESALVERVPGTCIIVSEVDRLWNTVMFVVPEHPNLKWLTRLANAGFAVSTGSACSAGRGNPSRVMEAMGLDYEEMGRVIRVSGGWETTRADWMALAAAIEGVSTDLSSGSRQSGVDLGA